MDLDIEKITQQVIDELRECDGCTTTSSTGDYAYERPFMFKEGDEETYEIELDESYHSKSKKKSKKKKSKKYETINMDINSILESIDSEGNIKEDIDNNIWNQWGRGGLDELLYDTKPSKQFSDNFEKGVRGEFWGKDVANKDQTWSNGGRKSIVADNILNKVKSRAKDFEKPQKTYFKYGRELHTNHNTVRQARFAINESNDNTFKNNINESTYNDFELEPLGSNVNDKLQRLLYQGKGTEFYIEDLGGTYKTIFPSYLGFEVVTSSDKLEIEKTLIDYYKQSRNEHDDYVQKMDNFWGKNESKLNNMNKLTESFIYGKTYTNKHMSTDGMSISVYGNVIAENRDGLLYICDGGYQTDTIREVLNELPKVNITESNGEWLLNGSTWQGNWTLISEDKEVKNDTTIKRLTFKSKFLSEQDMLSKIPNKFKQDNIIFEMADGDNLYRLQWSEGNPSILKTSNILEGKKHIQELNKLMYHDTTVEKKTSNKLGESKMYEKLLNKMRSDNVQEKVTKQLINESLNPDYKNAFVEHENKMKRFLDKFGK